MRGDIETGFDHARRALALIEQSGAVAMHRACLGNLGNLHFAIGEFETAVDYFERAIAALPSPGDNYNAGVDGIARVRLFQDRLEECAALLDRIDESIQHPKDRSLYSHRYAQLTRTQLLARQGRFPEALASADIVMKLATEASDHLLHQLAMLTRAELLQLTGHTTQALDALDPVVDTLAQQTPDLYAHYDRIIGCTLTAEGNAGMAAVHFGRAKRLYDGLRSAPGLVELARRRHETVPARTASNEATPAQPTVTARDTLQTLAGLLRHHSRPELVARELVHLIGEAQCTTGVQAVSIAKDGASETLAAIDSPASSNGVLERRITVGVERDRSVELHAQVKPDTASRATMHSVGLLLATVRDLERARAEREERLRLWPVEDDPADSAGAVVNGHMRELMSYARRIANTTISVFITGESGTGKEVLARAIHSFSDRTAKPFIPFNCTAVPRDILESQLFGYRRGSFTGADRDSAGMIGAAREGTLFLDEIGELGLDLQPKLLRFLESGEICPIGETIPFKVDVRVIAATNSNVEQAVQEGRFREDLFYRLNVFRLRLPSLRERRDEIPGLIRHFLTQSATEFKKGDVRVSEDTMEHLLLCRWPGNIRQLQNELRRMVALAEPNATLTPADLSPEVFNARLAQRPAANEFDLTVSMKDKLPHAVARVEREMIRLALRDHHGNLDAAARALGISRKGLYLKRQRLGL